MTPRHAPRRTGREGPATASPALVSSMVEGVTEGYERNLEINGVGFRPRSRAGARPRARLLAPGRVQAARGDHRRRSTQEADRASRRRQAGSSARPPRRSARSARPSRTRARASSTRRRSSAARKARPAPARRHGKHAHAAASRAAARRERHVESASREKRKARIRGRSPAPPSARASPSSARRKHIYAQVVDDTPARPSRPRRRPRGRSRATSRTTTRPPPQDGRQGRRSRSWLKAKKGIERSCSTATASSTTGASRRSPTAAREAGLKF